MNDLKPKFYLFESKFPKRTNFTEGFIKLCKELDIKYEIKVSCTRYAYDNSDNTVWILFFGDDIEERIKATELLLNVEYDEQKVFSVSGNGYGTGLTVMLKFNKFYK